jgi:hypothetical protein
MHVKAVVESFAKKERKSSRIHLISWWRVITLLVISMSNAISISSAEHVAVVKY